MKNTGCFLQMSRIIKGLIEYMFPNYLFNIVTNLPRTHILGSVFDDASQCQSYHCHVVVSRPESFALLQIGQTLKNKCRFENFPNGPTRRK